MVEPGRGAGKTQTTARPQTEDALLSAGTTGAGLADLLPKKRKGSCFSGRSTSLQVRKPASVGRTGRSAGRWGGESKQQRGRRWRARFSLLVKVGQDLRTCCQRKEKVLASLEVPQVRKSGSPLRMGKSFFFGTCPKVRTENMQTFLGSSHRLLRARPPPNVSEPSFPSFPSFRAGFGRKAYPSGMPALGKVGAGRAPRGALKGKPWREGAGSAGACRSANFS